MEGMWAGLHKHTHTHFLCNILTMVTHTHTHTHFILSLPDKADEWCMLGTWTQMDRHTHTHTHTHKRTHAHTYTLPHSISNLSDNMVVRHHSMLGWQGKLLPLPTKTHTCTHIVQIHQHTHTHTHIQVYMLGAVGWGLAVGVGCRGMVYIAPRNWSAMRPASLRPLSRAPCTVAG